jgi:hypothetical protein
MRVEVDLTDAEREAVRSYADKEGYQMSGAYAQLIRDALFTQVKVDFDWGDPGEFMARVAYDKKEISCPFSNALDREGTYAVSAENLQHVPDELLEEGPPVKVDGD